MFREPWKIGARIRRERFKAGIGQSELARLLGVTRQTVFNLEKDRTGISLERLYKLADVLRCPVTAFFGIRRMWA